ncbi:hypothetical protein [Hymenobacter siberiensis]|uniref:hypothetical protein n=1 Tax=Hymenobacter siberiensis TaxID=2848396 RepID=UPI001C1E646C|nr:hypothetical protein [Hymenobacter siberiensis]
MKLARCSSREPYECKKDWPDNCFVQAGNCGIVFDAKHEEGGYETAFFEAFPKYQQGSTFIRGEGKTIEEAEASAFAQHLRFKDCTHAEGYDARGYTNGCGFCKTCGMFASKVIPLTTHCVVCDALTQDAEDKHGNYYCDAHKDHIKQEDKHWVQIKLESMRDYLKTRTL